MNWYKLKNSQSIIEQKLEDILISNNSSFVYLTNDQYSYLKRSLGRFNRHPNGSIFFEIGDYLINKFVDGSIVLGRQSSIEAKRK